MIEAEGNGLSGPQFANSGKKLYDDNSTWSKLAWNSCIHRKPLGKAYKDWELKKNVYTYVYSSLVLKEIMNTFETKKSNLKQQRSISHLTVLWNTLETTCSRWIYSKRTGLYNVAKNRVWNR
jgi:hypothetical protein